MKAEYINPFLEAASSVIEQVVQIKPSPGPLAVKEIELADGDMLIKIGLHGQIEGNIIFGLSKQAALHIVSAMMGGIVLVELDDMARSAISELGNMISGNAGILLFNKGILVDITPPSIVDLQQSELIHNKKALTVPLLMEGIGHLDIQVIVA